MRQKCSSWGQSVQFSSSSYTVWSEPYFPFYTEVSRCTFLMYLSSSQLMFYVFTAIIFCWRKTSKGSVRKGKTKGKRSILTLYKYWLSKVTLLSLSPRNLYWMSDLFKRKIVIEHISLTKNQYFQVTASIYQAMPKKLNMLTDLLFISNYLSCKGLW